MNTVISLSWLKIERLFLHSQSRISYTVTQEAPDPSDWHFSITAPTQKTHVHTEQKSPNDTSGIEGGKKVAGSYTGTADPQDLQLCLRSLPCLAEISAHGHALTINPDLYHILTGDSFLWENNQNISLRAKSRVLVPPGLQEEMLPWQASGAQVSARPVLQGLMEDLNHTATSPQPAIHSNHFCTGICKIKQLSTWTKTPQALWAFNIRRKTAIPVF